MERNYQGIKKRSAFFNIPAIGVYTKDIECLTSYISRLCELHNITVGVFVEKVIFPQTPKQKLLSKTGNHFGKKSAALNNSHASAKEIVRIIKILTGNKIVNLLTLVDYNSVFSKFELDGVKKWCPRCLEDWEKSREPLYSKLLWCFKEVKVCIEHRCMLLSSCFKCDTLQLPIHAKGREGYCQKCQVFLGEGAANSLTKEDDCFLWNEWLVKNIGELISLDTMERKVIKNNKDSIHTFLNEIKERTGLTKNLIAKEGKFDPGNFCYWQRGETKPSLLSLSRLCYMTNTSLLDYFTEQYLLKPPLKRLPKYLESPKNVNKSKYKDEELKKILKIIIAENVSEPPSLSQVARSLGYKKPETIKLRFPQECDIIIDRYQSHRAKATKEKRINIKNDIRRTILELIDQNIYPSYTSVGESLKNPSLFRNNIYKEMVKEIFNELNIIPRPRYYGGSRSMN
ncbi:TniQ family protein [Bacillus luteolus]|uniref:TniQ family protein n=1 Tax=Litchfieldia luteola TaxID=682179 RepID=A0ABR9QEM0_9BACI|nr:TniQ family protein [Cytobacillus luteolus]MBE4906942.1 TniQ family protein [Cytobacillus luteolus]MBP1943593.1 hypothetical protein [Cytobacillus luteolus]